MANIRGKVWQLGIPRHMVLIFCDPCDNSTALVLDWLIHLGQPFKVILTTDVITIKRIEIRPEIVFHFSVPSHDGILSTDMFTAVWYRRNMPGIQIPPLVVGDWLDEKFRTRLRSYWSMEQDALHDEFMRVLATIPSVGSAFHCGENTLRDLAAFAKVGGIIPKTLITTSKNEVQVFLDGFPHGVVCKKLNYGFNIDTPSGFFGQYTEIVDASTLDKLPEQFGLTLFQESIPKFVELRIYVLGDHLFAMAIFSQSNELTRTDFRLEQSHMRTAPFELPDEIKALIRFFMKEIGTNTGSIDMILTPLNEYVFLEINTIGQFGMVSQGCHYQLEKQIAHELRGAANPDLVIA